MAVHAEACSGNCQEALSHDRLSTGLAATVRTIVHSGERGDDLMEGVIRVRLEHSVHAPFYLVGRVFRLALAVGRARRVLVVVDDVGVLEQLVALFLEFSTEARELIGAER